MDEELQIQKPEPKISDVEIILIGVFYLIIDLIDLIPVAGDITDVVVAPMGFYYWMKGISAFSFIASEIIELIPGLQEVPTRTISWIITVWLDRHPKALGKLEAGIEIAGALEGDVSEGALAETDGGGGGPTGGTRKTLDMQKSADGTYEYQPQDEVAGGENKKPSETTTERGTEAEEETRRRQSERQPGEDVEGEQGENGNPQETEEQRRKRETGEDVTKMMESGAEKDPMQQAKEEDFPKDAQPFQKVEVEQEQEEESLAMSDWRKRFEKIQKQNQKNQQKQSLAQPQISEAPDKEDQDDDDLAQAA